VVPVCQALGEAPPQTTHGRVRPLRPVTSASLTPALPHLPVPAPGVPYVRAWCSRQACALPAVAQGAAGLSASPCGRTPERGCRQPQPVWHRSRFGPLLAEKNPCGSPGNAFHYLRECIQGQPSPARPALTSDLRRAVTSRVNETGPPPAGQGAPFIRTRNCRQGNGGRNSRIFRFFFLW